MSDRDEPSRIDTRYSSLRDRRRRRFLPPVSPGAARSGRAAGQLPKPTIYGTYNGGLRRDQLLADFATVQVTVGPWDYAAMTDTILLHWGDQWTQSFPVSSASGAQLLSIPGVDIAGDPIGSGDHFSGEGTHEIWYEVVPVSGGPQPSEVQEIVVKTARPGGEDPRPDTPVNDNLKPPIAAPNPVEKDTPAVTFSVLPWTNIVVGDKLTLVLAGYSFDFPAVTNIATSQTLVLTAAQIGATGGGPSTPVSYRIVDPVGNRSGFAPYLLLDIWLETGDRLEMIELFDGNSTPISGAIDPAMVDGFARVPRYAGWKPGESVTVFLAGVDSNEQPHDDTLGPLTWNATDYYLDFALPGDYLRLLAGGLVRVHYQSSDGGIAYRRSYVVDAMAETKLPAVAVLGEQNGELALDTITGDYVSIVIPDSEAFVDFARITLTMEGTSDTGPVLEEETHNVSEGNGHKPYTFAWPKTRIARLLDHQATFSYSIRTLDTASRQDSARPRLYRPDGVSESEPHPLLIRQTGAPGQLAPPVVHDLVDGAVDPELPRLRVTVPAGTASVSGAMVITYVAGLTTEDRVDQIFDDGEALIVDFPGWPALNDGARAKAWYAIDMKTSKETEFRIGGSSQLPRPVVPELVDGVLDGDLVAATMIVPVAARLQAQDIVLMRWTLQWGKVVVTKHTVLSTQVGEELALPVPRKDIHLSQGWMVALDYDVLRAASGETESSDRLVFRVRGASTWLEDFENVPNATIIKDRPFWHGNYCLMTINRFYNGVRGFVIGNIPSTPPYTVGRGTGPLNPTSYTFIVHLLRPCRALKLGCVNDHVNPTCNAKYWMKPVVQTELQSPVRTWVSCEGTSPEDTLMYVDIFGSSTSEVNYNDNLMMTWADEDAPPPPTHPVELTFENMSEGPLPEMEALIVSSSRYPVIATASPHPPYITGKYLEVTSTKYDECHVLSLRQSCRSLRIGYFTNADEMTCTILTTNSDDAILMPLSDTGMGWIDFTASAEQGLIHSIVFDVSPPPNAVFQVDNITLTYDEPWEITRA